MQCTQNHTVYTRTNRFIQSEQCVSLYTTIIYHTTEQDLSAALCNTTPIPYKKHMFQRTSIGLSIQISFSSNTYHYIIYGSGIAVMDMMMTWNNNIITRHQMKISESLVSILKKFRSRTMATYKRFTGCLSLIPAGNFQMKESSIHDSFDVGICTWHNHTHNSN